MKVAIVGASGLVGRTLLKLLFEQNLPVNDLYLFCGDNSDKKTVEIYGNVFTFHKLTESEIISNSFDIVFFATSAEVSKKYAPMFIKRGACVIDNSSYFRPLKDVPLVSAYVNLNNVLKKSGLIANPNCSTLILVPVLNALKPFGLKRVIVTTYQAVSGAGKKGISDLNNGMKNIPPVYFEKPIFGNCIPKIGAFYKSGYCDEEIKIINESKKILDLPRLKITATTVRVPIFNCHSEAINIELNQNISESEVIRALKGQEGIVYIGDDDYPTATFCDGKNYVYVGRVRRDNSNENAFWIWAVSDNLRVGAALNAVLITKKLIGYDF